MPPFAGKSNLGLFSYVDPLQAAPPGRHRGEGKPVLSIARIEEVCEGKGVTLVMHPAIRQAVKGYEEGFYVGASCFLRGETDGLFFLPLPGGGHVRLLFSKRFSSQGHRILRVDPVAPDALARIKAAVRGMEQT